MTGIPLKSACSNCEGRGWLSLDVPVKHARFGEIVPCPTCQPDYRPWQPGDEVVDWGTCPYHNMPYRKFKNGRIGHNAGTRDSPLWCMKGGHPPEKQLEKYWESLYREGLHELYENLGLAWCPLHRQYEPADDPYDFPVSRGFLRWAARQGFSPQYPGLEDETEKERWQREQDPWQADVSEMGLPFHFRPKGRAQRSKPVRRYRLTPPRSIHEAYERAGE